jgi:hypothetical protein
MVASPRRDIIRDGEIATYHVWSQTAQQRFLLGKDRGPYGTYEDFGHRKAWCESLLEHQARIFAVDISTYQFLDNHFHLIVRTRPDLVDRLTDEEVAYRWLLAWAELDRESYRWSRVPTDAEVHAVLKNEDKLKNARHGLSSLSWFVGRLKESIAREANFEVGAKGHFWAERFGSRELVDDAAILVCSVYVDMNQIRAGMAPSLLESKYTAIQGHILQGRLEEAQAAHAMFQDLKERNVNLTLEEIRDMYFKCRWLAPVSPQGDLKMVNDAWCAKETRKVPISIQTQAKQAKQPDPTPALAGLCREFGVDLETERLIQVLEAEWQARRPSPIRKSQQELPDGSMLEDQDAVEDVGSEPQESNSSHGVEVENSDESLSEDDDNEGDQDGEPEASDTRKRRKNSSPKKAGPAYAIHNRLCQQLPDRSSNSPVLVIPLDQYFSVMLSASNRCLILPSLKDKKLPIPMEVSDHDAAILRDRGINPEAWYAALDSFEIFFGYAMGLPDRMKAFAARAGRRCVHGITACRALFFPTDEGQEDGSASSPPPDSTTGPPLEGGAPA